MKTYRIIREWDTVRECYFWFAYKVTFFHRLFGRPWGYIGASCSNVSAQDCENRLKKAIRKEPDKIEWDVRL